MNYRFVFVFSTFLICLVSAVVVNVIYGIDVVYTHLFYIPVILTGIWYPRYAIFLAAALGLIHIACDYTTVKALKIGSLIRAVMFMVVAYVTSYLALGLDRLLNALREGEEKYRTVADFTYAWEYLRNPDGKYLYVSPACERISGYTVEEFQIDPNLMEKITHPDDKHRLTVHLHDILQGKSDACELEFRIITRAGKECWNRIRRN